MKRSLDETQIYGAIFFTNTVEPLLTAPYLRRALLCPGARFSKVPIINGPGKLPQFTVIIKVSIVLHLK